MDFTTFKTNVRNLIAAVCDPIPDGMTVWAKEAQPHTRTVQQALIKIDLIADRGVGRYERRVASLNNTAQLKYRQMRYATVQITAECISHAGDKFAFAWLTQILDRLQWESSRTAFENADLGFTGWSDIREFPNFIVDQHEYSRATLDLTLARLHEVIDGDYDGSWIETVYLYSPFLPNSPFIFVDPNYEDEDLQTAHFALGAVGTPVEAAAAGTADVDAMAVFGQFNIHKILTIASIEAHMVKAGTSGDLVVEVYRRRAGVFTLLATLTINGPSTNHAVNTVVPTGDLASLNAGDYLFTQIVDGTLVSSGGADGLTVDVHFNQ